MSKSSLFDQAANALKWNYLGAAARFLIQFGIGILLARLLGPKPFGLIGMAMVVIGFGFIISDAGFGPVIIQKETIIKEDIRASFTLQIVLGLFIYLSLLVLSPIVATFYNEPMLLRILPILGLALLLQNSGTTAVSLLKRNLNFKRIQIINITSYIVGYGCVGLFCALMGYGVWSLVSASIIQITLVSVLSYVSVAHSIRPSVHIQSYKRLFGFGGKVTATNIVNYLSGIMDILIVGRLSGAKILGFYSRAFYLARLPSDYFSTTLQAVTFPAYSRIQGQFGKIGIAYKMQIGIISMITMSVFWGMALCADTLILALFGPEWSPAGPPLRILCLAMPFHSIMALAGPTLWSQDRVEQALFRQILFLILISLAIWYGAKFGITGVAAGVAVAYFFRYILLSQAAIRLTGIGWLDFLRAHVGGMLLSVFPLISLYVVDKTLSATGFHPSVKLVLIMFTGILSVAASIFCLPASWLGDPLFWLYSKLKGKLPVRFDKFIHGKLYGTGR